MSGRTGDAQEEGVEKVPVALYRARRVGGQDGQHPTHEVCYVVDECRFTCNCGGGPQCEHIVDVLRTTKANGGRITLIPNSKDIPSDKMQRMVEDPEALREFLLEHLPILEL